MENVAHIMSSARNLSLLDAGHIENDKDPEYNRKTETGNPRFARSWTDTLAFPRAFTEVAFSLIDFESEEAWTKRLLDEYHEVFKDGPEGDIPIPEGFGRTRDFWVLFILSGVFGIIVGFVGLIALNIVEEVPKLWVDNGEFDEPSDCDFHAGKAYWIGITTAMGFVVGLIRWFTSYPEKVPGFFKEIKDCHVDPKHVPLTVTLSIISLSGGASMGPEMCLGNFGGGLATYISERVTLNDPQNSKLIVLSGMSAALGALFPSPWLAVMLIGELSPQLPKSYMETYTVMAVGAIVSWSIYTSLVEKTYLHEIPKSLKLTIFWDFEMWNLGTGLICGILSGFLCVTQLIAIGITKQIFVRLKKKCAALSIPGTIIAPTIGGLIIGLINMALPLTVGDGNLVVTSIINFTYGNLLSRNLLLASGMTDT